MDELNKIDYVIYETLKWLLFDTVPEFKTVVELENGDNHLDGVYLFMNGFASFLNNEIERNPASTIVSKAFVFINQIGESNNLEILNILKVGILEILYTGKKINRKIVSDCLSEKLQKYFHEFSNYYY